MNYRITYQPKDEIAQTIIVTGMLAVFALIDYANKWQATIVSVEERENRARTWKPTAITQKD